MDVVFVVLLIIGFPLNLSLREYVGAVIVNTLPRTVR
jgi:hypothetical protein